MYYLYSPYLLSISIAALLAISTANIQKFLEKHLHSSLFAAFISSLLLAILFFAPLGYFLTTLTIWLNHLEPEFYYKFESIIQDFMLSPPEYLLFLEPYTEEWISNLNTQELTNTILSVTTTIGKLSASFLKNSVLIIIFYFFSIYNGASIVNFLKRIVQISVKKTSLLTRELSSIMSVVFYSIILTATFEGFLFGIAISYMGNNGLLFGIMYGFASLIPVVGGVLMWLPFMAFEFYIGNSTNAIFIALYSIIVISIIADTLIKPLIIKEINNRMLSDDDAKINELVIFFSIIAGLSSFGFWGMILGPAITAFFLTILKFFEERDLEV
jgi:predicted PurR-regulated permease PerM